MPVLEVIGASLPAERSLLSAGGSVEGGVCDELDVQKNVVWAMYS